jgi:hypothetical protein
LMIDYNFIYDGSEDFLNQFDTNPVAFSQDGIPFRLLGFARRIYSLQTLCSLDNANLAGSDKSQRENPDDLFIQAVNFRPQTPQLIAAHAGCLKVFSSRG